MHLEKLFSKYLSTKNREFVLKEYSINEWQKIIKLCGSRLITNDSVKLAQKIYKSSGEIVFPIIFSRHAGYLLKEMGAWSWIMYGLNLQEVGCTHTAADCLNKNNYLIRSNNWLCNPAGKELWLDHISTNKSK